MLSNIQVLQQEPRNIKALLRRATAREGLGDAGATLQNVFSHPASIKAKLLNGFEMRYDTCPQFV
jgi:hypothetical protein